MEQHDLAGRHVSRPGRRQGRHPSLPLLHEAGARLTIADVDVDNVGRAVKEFGAETVEPGKAHAVECDIFAPTPWGRWSTTTPCPELKCAAIAGSANNVLARDEHGYALRQLGILYAPDYVVNAGGLINVADELQGYSPSGPRPRSRASSAPSATSSAPRPTASPARPPTASPRTACATSPGLRLIRVLPGVSGWVPERGRRPLPSAEPLMGG